MKRPSGTIVQLRSFVGIRAAVASFVTPESMSSLMRLRDRNELVAKRANVRPCHDLAVSGDGGVEVERKRLVEGRDPFAAAPAVGVVDKGCGAVQEVAAVNRPEVGKVDDGVAVRVSTTEVIRPDLDPAEIDSRLAREDDPGRARLLVLDHVVSRVLVGDHLGDVDVFDVSPGMVAVVVGVDHIPDRLVGHIRYAVLYLGEVPWKLVVDEDDSLGGDPYPDVAAGAVDQEQPVLHWPDAERLRLLSAHRNDDQRSDKRRRNNHRPCCLSHRVLLLTRDTSTSPLGVGGKRLYFKVPRQIMVVRVGSVKGARQ